MLGGTCESHTKLTNLPINQPSPSQPTNQLTNQITHPPTTFEAIDYLQCLFLNHKYKKYWKTQKDTQNYISFQNILQ